MEFFEQIKIQTYNGQAICFLQKKADGHYIEIYKSKDLLAALPPYPDGVAIFGKYRKSDLWDKLRHVERIARLIQSLPQETILLAELHANSSNIPATSVPTLLNDADDRLEIMVFAMPLYEGQDYSEEGWEWVSNILHNTHGFSVPETRFIFTYDDPKSLSVENVCQLKEEARRNNIEGFVVKRGHCDSWYKIKPTNTIDCVVTGATESISRTYNGALKGIQCSVYKDGELVEICSTGTGLDADFKNKYNTDEERAKLIGRVVEIEYDCVAAKGRLKFPRVKCWREDKDAVRCLFDQLGD